MGWVGELLWWMVMHVPTIQLEEVPKHLYEDGSLAIINGELTVIGGCQNVLFNAQVTGKLFCLMENWEELFPPTPTEKYMTTAITAKEHLIVAGGVTQSRVCTIITTVEVMDTDNLFWSTVASLPFPCHLMSMTIHGDHLYMMGGLDDKA